MYMPKTTLSPQTTKRTPWNMKQQRIFVKQERSTFCNNTCILFNKTYTQTIWLQIIYPRLFCVVYIIRNVMLNCSSRLIKITWNSHIHIWRKSKKNIIFHARKCDTARTESHKRTLNCIVFMLFHQAIKLRYSVKTTTLSKYLLNIVHGGIIRHFWYPKSCDSTKKCF